LNNVFLLKQHCFKIILEDLAPDGGWGWMIALARILIMVSIILMRDRYNSVIETYITLYL